MSGQETSDRRDQRPGINPDNFRIRTDPEKLFDFPPCQSLIVRVSRLMRTPVQKKQIPPGLTDPQHFSRYPLPHLIIGQGREHSGFKNQIEFPLGKICFRSVTMYKPYRRIELSRRLQSVSLDLYTCNIFRSISDPQKLKKVSTPAASHIKNFGVSGFV